MYSLLFSKNFYCLPVDPRMVNGCPENIPNKTPQIIPETRDSMDAMWFLVASPNRPPKVMIGVKQAK